MVEPFQLDTPHIVYLDAMILGHDEAGVRDVRPYVLGGDEVGEDGPAAVFGQVSRH